MYAFSDEIFHHALFSVKCDYLIEKRYLNSKFQPVQYLEITYDLLKTFSLCYYIKERFNRKFNLA